MKKSEVAKEKVSGSWTPVGKRVIIQRDEFKDTTKGGIVLPDADKMMQLTGRVVSISPELMEDAYKYPFQVFDKVIYNPSRACPVSLEDAIIKSKEQQLFIVPVEDVLAVYKNNDED